MPINVFYIDHSQKNNIPLIFISLFKSMLPIENNGRSAKAKLFLSFICTDGTKKPARPAGGAKAISPPCMLRRW